MLGQQQPASTSRHLLEGLADPELAELRSDCGGPDKGPDDEPETTAIAIASRPIYAGSSVTWQTVRQYACLGTVMAVLLGLVVGMICVGVIPSQNYSSVTATSSANRVYYLAAEEVNWTYTPGGKDALYENIQGTLVNKTTPEGNILGSFIKGRFIQYTDATYTVKTPIPENWIHLGILGPIMHAEAGDTIEVHLRNLLGVPINLEPLGTGWNIQGDLGPVGSGLEAMYTILVPADAGPPPDSAQSSHFFFYRSSLDPTRHENSGLIGGIIITRKGEANPDGTPKGVDREIVTIYQIYDETETEFSVFNGPFWTEYNWDTTRYTINGRAFGTLEGLNMSVGERVRWYVGGLGTENAMHNFHWHGNVLTTDGHYVDQLTAIPATTMVADMLPDNPGVWLFHCHTNSHLTGGMDTRYTVTGPMPPPTTGGVVRTYYIAADEVEWSYAPLGGMGCTVNGTVLPFNAEASTYLGPPEGVRLGSNVTKAIFREYTDGNFTTLKPRAAEDEYLGLLGPLIRAQVGDTIRIVLRNQLKSNFPVTLHPHGVLYNKSSEGAPYDDGTSGYEHADDAVYPGTEHTYIWEVPERAGPGPQDPSSLLWMYHSHYDEARDTWAGLVGGMLITRRGVPVRADGSPLDIVTERVLFYSAIDESQTLFSVLNLMTLLGMNESAANELLANPTADFAAAALHRSINGYMYCNLPRMQLPLGQLSRLHVMALGDIGDMHTPKMGPGGGFLDLGQREDTVEMSAGAMHSVDVILTARGTWQLGCKVLEHEVGGISAMYSVEVPANNVTLTAANRKVVEYFVQAEEVLWDYAPGGYVHCTVVDYTVNSAKYLIRSNATIGSGLYYKALYREYSDATFTTLVEQPPYQGILGPLMVVETNDVLRVTLKNTLTFPINFSPGGGLVTTNSDPQAGQVVQPGETFVYEYVVPEEAGPTLGGMSSVAYAYSSTIDPWTTALLGLEGMLVVVTQGRLQPAPDRPGAQLGATTMPDDVDYLVPLLWEVFNQNLSPFLDGDITRAGLDLASINKTDPDFVESNMKHSINGFMYCNLPPPEFALGSRVRLVLMSVGSIEGLHAPVVTKFPLFDNKGAHDSATLMPGYVSTMDLYADYTGLFAMWCNVHDHIEAGMSGQYLIQ